MTIEAVIFDFGGVIVPGSPTGDDPNSPMALLEREHGLPTGFLWPAVYLNNPGWLQLRVGEGSYDAWDVLSRDAIAAISNMETATVVVAALSAARPQGPGLRNKQPEFNEGMLPLIGRLRTRYRVGLLSNAAPGLEDELRDHYKIHDLFHDVINSATVRLAKPDPAIYRLAAERIGLPIDACFFVDDLAHNIASARETGMTAHQFTGYAGLAEALRTAGVTPD